VTSPRDVFPHGAGTGRSRDVDHPDPYLPPDRGGPPGQTRLDNAAPMRRFHHRLKTSGRWRLRQPDPGTYLWRSPHGYHWLTTHTGTHRLPHTIGQTLWDALTTPTTKPPETAGCSSVKVAGCTLSLVLPASNLRAMSRDRKSLAWAGDGGHTLAVLDVTDPRATPKEVTVPSGGLSSRLWSTSNATRLCGGYRQSGTVS